MLQINISFHSMIEECTMQGSFSFGKVSGNS